MNFELDLLPVISMMSVCICFLLLTAVWTQIGSVDIEQGLGQELSKPTAEASASLWVTMKKNTIEFSLKDSPGTASQLAERKFNVNGTAINWNEVDSQAASLKQALPTLKTALIMPDSNVSYGDVIRMMDRLKIRNISEIGIAPL
jgi:biopolymer transport protein TolR